MSISVPASAGHPPSGTPAVGRLLVVLPIISSTYADRCVESLLRPDSAAEVDPDDILVVDNSREGFVAQRYGLATYRDPDGHNLGVARSWNIGARRLLDSERDYLTLMSASMLFGPVLHTSWTRQMLAFWGENIVESEGNSWHLISIHRRVFEKVGLFDSNYYPAYMEAEDYSYRMRMVGWEGGWTRVWINALSQGHALHHPLIRCPAQPLTEYRVRKWGGAKNQEAWTLPFGDKPLGYFPESSIPELAERYDLGTYGEGWW